MSRSSDFYDNDKRRQQMMEPITLPLCEHVHVHGVKTLGAMPKSKSVTNYNNTMQQTQLYYTVQRETFEGDEFCGLQIMQESFVHEILGMPHPPIQFLQHSAKVFSVKCSLPINPQNFSPSRFPTILWYHPAAMIIPIHRKNAAWLH